VGRAPLDFSHYYNVKLSAELISLPGGAEHGGIVPGGLSVKSTLPAPGAAEKPSAGIGILCVDGASHHSVDLTKVVTLIEDAFGATLPADYFSSMMPGRAGAARTLRQLYVAEDYSGCAVVTEEAGMPGVAYLDKVSLIQVPGSWSRCFWNSAVNGFSARFYLQFATSKSSRGTGVGKKVWEAMVAQEKSLYWRSRSVNPANAFYAKNSSGSFEEKPWTVFWRGLDAVDIAPAIATALALKPTFPIKTYPSSGSAADQAMAASQGASATEPALK
jgi:GNAT superfamily N-acetyltransferase